MAERHALKHGHLLTLENQTYRLHGEPIHGGSSLVYKARPENDKTTDFYMIKELNPLIPLDGDILVLERMPDGGFLIPDSLRERFESHKKRAKRESVIVRKLRHGKGSTNNDPWFLSYSKPVNKNDTLYTVIATESGEVLSERINKKYFEAKSYEEVCDCVLSILDAVEPVHKNGYLHLDIAPDNIHFSDLKIARLIDFNSACHTGEITQGLRLSRKAGYSAPELTGDTHRPLAVSYATDLFSVAAIFFELLMGRTQNDDDRMDFANLICDINRNAHLKGASELLVKLTGDFMIKGMAHGPQNRFQSVEEMREAVERMRRLKAETEMVNDPNRVKPACFIGRDDSLRKIGEALARDSYVFLEGIGGIGKTELAKAYAWKNNYHIVQLVSFGRNLRETVASGLRFYNFDTSAYKEYGDKAIKQIFLAKADRLKKYAESGQRVLIIIDNYSHTSREDFEDFTSGEHHVIFTTREKLGGLEIAPMDEDTLLALFAKYCAPYRLSPGDIPVIREIIKTVANHTMTIMLAAAAMKNGGAKAEEILKCLRDGRHERSIMGHILTLFDMTAIKGYPLHEHIMVNMAVVPEAGIKKEEFFRLAMCGPRDDMYTGQHMARASFADLDWLRDLRWVQEFFDGDVPYISLHAIIAEVASRELRPDSVKCGGLVSGLIISAFGDNYTEAAAAANRIKTACKRINDGTVLARDLYYRYARLSSFLADYSSARTYYEKVAALHEKEMGKDNPATASLYKDVAMMCFKSGDTDGALEWHEKASAALSKTPEHPLHATLYNNIAAIYNDKGEHALARANYKQALKLYAARHGFEHADSAMAVNNVATTYLHQRNFDEAKAWLEKARILRETVHGKEHQATAATYSNIAVGCNYQGKYARALEWEQKALPIREKILGKEHPETAVSYHNLGCAYDGLGDKEKAAEFFQKAYDIKAKKFGKADARTIEAYRCLYSVKN